MQGFHPEGFPAIMSKKVVSPSVYLTKDFYFCIASLWQVFLWVGVSVGHMLEISSLVFCYLVLKALEIFTIRKAACRFLPWRPEKSGFVKWLIYFLKTIFILQRNFPVLLPIMLFWESLRSMFCCNGGRRIS